MSDEITPPTPPAGDPAQAGPGATPPPPGSGATGAGAPPPPPPGGAAPGGSAGAGAPPPPPAGGGASNNRQLMLVLSYLGILALIPFLAEPNDPEVRWHSRNGLALFVADIVVTFVLWIISLVLTAILAVLGCLFAVLWTVVGLAILAFHIFVMVKALNGVRYRIPYVTDYAEKIP